MRTSMTTLTQMWMTLLLSNILPSDHNFDLPLLKCQLGYAILTGMSIHMAQLIANAIYIFAGMTPTRYPLDLEKSNKALGFLALITVRKRKKKKTKRKFPVKDRKKTQGKRKFPIKDRKKMKELYKRVFGPDKYPNNAE